MPELQRRSALGREARIVNMTELGKALTALDEPPVKAIVVYNSNPAGIAPNQNLVLRGFRRPDLFTVVLEQFQTDTRGSRRHSAAVDHVPGAHRSVSRLRPLLCAARASRAGSARGSALERRGFPRPGRAHGFRRRLFPRIRRRHDPRIARVRSSVSRRHHARTPGSRAFRPAESAASRFCPSPKADSARLPANANSARSICDYHTAVRIPLRRPGA